MNIQENQLSDVSVADACVTMHISSEHYICDLCGKKSSLLYMVNELEIKEQLTCRSCGFKSRSQTFILQ